MLAASLVIQNANVITLNSRQPRARAIAIRDNRVAAVGSNKQIKNYAGKETQIVDAQNGTVLPGLVDCHVHMSGFGSYLQSLDLRDVESIKELQRKLRDYASKNSSKSWIQGGRWDHERFAERRFPTRFDLDAAVRDKPVFLLRVCGHSCVVNSKALELTGISRETKVDGGQVVLDETTGKPSGVLLENAVSLIWKAVPRPSQDEVEESCLQAAMKAAEEGLTCVHWLANGPQEIRAIQKHLSEGKLPIRVNLAIPAELLDELANLGFATGFGSDMIKIGFVKMFADGSLGSHTAALKEPYSDKPETKGMLLYTQKRLNKLVQKAHEAGLQVGIHAIGDRAVEAAIKAFEEAFKKHPKKNHRHRIEHCSVLTADLVKRMKRLSLIASVQPHFVFSDFWAADRVGKDRERWLYPFRTLIEEGIVVASGSDCPVEPISPILGIWAAVTRKESPNENLTLEEAIRTYTLNAAYASFDEKKRGSIEVGKLADLTILSDDLDKIPEDKIQEVSVTMTIVDGKVVYSRS